MTGAVGVIAEQVRERVRREGVDLHSDRSLADRLVRDEVQRYAELALDIDRWSSIMQAVGAAVDTYGKMFQMNPWQ